MRLSLFAEMMKGRPWTLESLKEVGGTTGVGATFLEETFSASEAPPAHRYHQVAARAVLRSLLPSGGTEIKGHRRSRIELLAASGYALRDRDFADLMRILDGELRLITPVDTIEPQALAALPHNSFTQTRLAPAAQEQQTRLAPAAQYQLTHDYLVPSLRDWLTSKQRETKRGRAELKLEERASAWNAKREAKQLPTLTEWFGISRLTDRKHWTDSQRSMMRSATRVHMTRVGLAATLIMALSGIGLTTKGYIDRQRESLIAQKRMEKLEAEALDGKQPSTRRFHAASALAGFDPSNAAWDEPKFASFVSEQLVAVSPTYVSQYQELVRPVSAKLVPALTTIFKDLARGELARTLATSLLADYAAQDPSTLVDLVLAADAPSDKALFPVLQRHREVAVKRFESILYRSVKPNWHDAPLDKNWVEPDAAIRASIETAHGMIGERFAYVVDMPLDKFIEVTEKLRSSGYRPTRVRAWSIPEPRALAAIYQNGLLIKTRLAPAAQIEHTRLVAALVANLSRRR